MRTKWVHVHFCIWGCVGQPALMYCEKVSSIPKYGHYHYHITYLLTYLLTTTTYVF